MRADAAARIATGLTTVTGEPARVLATVRRGEEVGVVMAGPVAAPPGWTIVPGGLRVPASVRTAALVAGVPEALAAVDPAAFELEASDGAVVTVHLDAFGRLEVSGRAAEPPTVTALLRALLACPLAVTVDVVTVGLPLAWLPAVAAASGGRLHALDRPGQLGPALAALAGGEDPVVVVGPAAVLDDPACASPDRAGVAVVRLGGPPGTGWQLTDAGPAIRLLPLGMDVLL